MSITSIDVEISYSVTPSGVASSFIQDWEGMEIKDINLEDALSALEKAIDSWVNVWAENPEYFR